MGDSMFSFAINEMVKLHGEWGEVFKHLRSTQCILKTFHFRRVTFVDVCLQCDSPTLTTLHGCCQAGADDDFKIWRRKKHVCTSTAVLKGQFYLIDPVRRRRLMSRSYEGNLFNYFFSWFFQMMRLLQGDPCQRSVHDVPNSHRGSTPFPLHSSPWSIVLWSFMHFPILAEVQRISFSVRFWARSLRRRWSSPTGSSSSSTTSWWTASLGRVSRSSRVGSLLRVTKSLLLAVYNMCISA